MSTSFLDAGNLAHPSAGFSRWIKQARLPLEAWSAQRRALVAALLAALVFGVGAYGWQAADLSGLAASRAALASSTARLADAQQAVARLPSLRRETGTLIGTASTAVTSGSADDVRIVSELATQNGVALLGLEPGTASGEGAERMRPLRLTARTDFVHLMAFFHGLAQLPVLIVPVDVTVKQDGNALAMNATLHVFDALPSARGAAVADAAAASLHADDANDDDEEVVFFDPFARAQMSASGFPLDAARLRLVGMLRDRTRALALLDTPEGTTTVGTGHRLGVERVMRLDADGITLANGSATRTLTLMSMEAS
ncbi:pilus assembly protein PilP [Paraburkholderia sp. MMS20-SJTR3]|uniref:Pilus assembly protein PilP n=1 Tax=Paraburkholderia sejongensis TaxID=2886946 RepID=A0ABS8K2V5_9BURK|nr:pilus assembly protein PilP [Paraburkholderia sp. MMS20-SJTR3]MCC8396488.1 pilus assembly protein PilP [Paraburkholderia sp. MMS20-SJTR3]